MIQYRIPRRWLYRDSGQWLDQEPWYPDYQIRFVRNDPATLRFPGTLHSSAEPVLPARYVLEPIYHLTFLVASETERARRVSEYERQAEAPEVDNALFYLPERHHGLSVAGTPPADVEIAGSRT